MYQNLLFGLKKRMLDEVVGAFNRHPAYAEKVLVYHKFPYEQRVQYGVVLRNTNASQIRMSADNYMADSVSHLRLARVSNYPGLSIEWVRENSLNVTEEVEEDVSYQLGPTQRLFTTSNQILAGFGDTHYASNSGQVSIKINGQEVLPESVDGEDRTVLLRDSPAQGAVVKIRYFTRKLAPPGIYVIDFTEDTQFVVGPVYTIENRTLISRTTGAESSVSLGNTLVYQGSEELYLSSANGGNPILLVRDTDYSIDYGTGLVTFLVPLDSDFKLEADFNYQPGYGLGPFVFHAYEEVHDAIPGVVLCIGRRAKSGDRQVVIVSRNREQQAKIYGGHWTMSLDFAVIAKDPMQMEEMADQIVNYLWVERKNVLEYEGITLNRVEPSGESEEAFIDSTGDLYYITSMSVEVMTEWQEFVPYFFKIRRIPQILNGSFILSPLQADMRTILKYGVTSYERIG